MVHGRQSCEVREAKNRSLIDEYAALAQLDSKICKNFSAAWVEAAALPLQPPHGVQDALGYLPEGSIEVIAQALNLSRAEVHGVISYYHHFRSEPVGRLQLQICRAESCQSMGVNALWKDGCAPLDCASAGGTSADCAATLEPVYCLGLCAASPALTLNGQPHAWLSPGKLKRLLDQVGSAA
jgi:formate dehydrogenase subunit gamma